MAAPGGVWATPTVLPLLVRRSRSFPHLRACQEKNTTTLLTHSPQSNYSSARRARFLSNLLK